jgi:hypothetical protein
VSVVRRPPRGHAARRTAIVAAGILLLTGCAAPLTLVSGGSAHRSVAPPRTTAAPGAADPTTGSGPTGAPVPTPGQTRPTPGFEEGPRPAGRPLAVLRLRPGVPFRFNALQDDGRTGVAWSPCRPIHYVVRTRNQPAWGATALRTALAEVSKATGLRFVYDGTTTEGSRTARTLYQPKRYGDRWAPVVIAWSAPKETKVLRGDVAGVTNVYWWQYGDEPASLVSGAVQLDTPDLVRLQRGLGTSVARGVILHELGHLVGLGHVKDKRQNMYPEISPRNVRFASGDLAGLSLLGQGPCNPDL